METRYAVVLGITALLFGGFAGSQVTTVTQTAAEQTLEAYPLDLALSGQHRHDRLNVAPEEAPSVSIDVQRDPMMPTHFNLRIQPEGLEFAPESVSGDHVRGEGHAHVFVDGVKISRAYSEWYHLPRLNPGNHTITVTLNTNDHREYAVDGESIKAEETVHVSDDAEMNMGAHTRNHADAEEHTHK
jgi:hypothetical protein